MPSAYKKKRNTQRKYTKKTKRTKKQYAGDILDSGRGVIDNFKIPFLVVAATVAVPVLGAVAANAAKNAVINKISNWGYDQITSKMINNVLTEIKEIFEDGNYVVNVEKIRRNKNIIPEDIASNTHYQCLAPNQKKTIDRLNVGPLVTVLRQTYSGREFKYDNDPNSPYALFDTRKKLIKFILKMIFGDIQEYDAHINPFAIKANSVVGSIGKLATTPLSFIGRKSIQTANSRISDIQVYKKLIEQLYDLLGVKLNTDETKLVPKEGEVKPNACKINYFAKYDKKAINTENPGNESQYMIYKGEPDKDIFLYEILNATKEEIKYFKNSDTIKPIITFKDLWERYKTKTKNENKKQILSEDDYQKNYDKMFKYLVNNVNNSNKIESDSIVSDIFRLVYNKPIFENLYGENIPKYLNRSNEKSPNENAFLNIFNFFFYNPPPPPEEDVPVFKKDKDNPDKYIPATDKNGTPKTIKRAEGNNYWSWSPEYGYKINNCFGQKEKYTFIDSHKVCIERIEDNDTDDNVNTSETSENPQKDDNGEIRKTETVGENKEQVPVKNTRINSKETLFQTQRNFRRKKKIEFSEKVTNVIAALKRKIGKMKKTPLCDDCSKTFDSINKMTIADIRAYLKEKKPCLCKNHIAEFMDKIIEEKKEKNKKGGTQKRRRTSKGGSPSLEQKTTNALMEQIHTIDGSLPLMNNKEPIVEITRLLNYMINHQIPLDMNYTGNNPSIGPDDRPLRALLFSYFTVMQKVQEKDKTRFEKVFIEFFTIFLIGFINNQEINTIGYDPVYDYEHSIHNMIDLLCNPKYRQLKDSILENMRNMANNNNPKSNPAIREIVQNILNGDIMKELCSPIEPTDATITTEGVQKMTEKQRKRWNTRLRQYRNSLYSRRKSKNKELTKATLIPVKKIIYGIDHLTLRHPEGTVNDEDEAEPFINHAEPDPTQIIRQRDRLLHKEIRNLRSSSRGGTESKKTKKIRKTRKIV